MKVTIAICTWNRAAMLGDTLLSLTKMDVPPQLEWEVIVVNNNSSDATDHIISSFNGLLPIRRIFENQPGLSNARNAAVSVFTGDYILWTDDDVLVEPVWLRSYVAAFKRHPDSAVFGGPIKPYFEHNPPQWLIDGIRYVPEAFGIRNLSPVETQLVPQSQQFPFGANFAIRRAEQMAFPYNPAIGRSPSNAFLGGEEIQVMSGIMAAGHSGWWVPNSIVSHRIRAEQLQLDYVKKFYVGVGRWMGLSDREIKYPTIMGYPRWMLRELLMRQARYWFLLTTAPRAETLAELKAACILRGRLLATSTRASSCA